MKNLVWLASYPKSGNTWLRLFLANYLAGSTTPVPIDRVDQYSTGDSVARRYASVATPKPFDPRDDHSALMLRRPMFQALSGNGADVNLVKTHNRNKRIEGVRLIPPEMTRHAFYIVRDPLDVLVSYADHYGLTPLQAADDLANVNGTVLPGAATVRQFTGNWSEHVTSWTRSSKFPVTVLRYEDMSADPEAAFGTVLQKLGAPADQSRLIRALEASQFSELRKQEDATGFVEKSPLAKKFFRSGKTGEGRRTLPTDVIEKVTADHHAVMSKFGYLP